MKSLIILAHPDIKNSVINKQFLKEAAVQSFTVRDLAREYPSGEIDGERERAIIKAHDALVLQFPLHNFSSPAIRDFKKLDRCDDDIRTCLRTHERGHTGARRGAGGERGHQARRLRA
ncbi:NAD(P)H-dependent oxidoreductase [uncultured Campylobacter sp.]|uniref:NAD(P)H-dependent oxidoreductase n=1 Tax=uncultured Campylobacter sp. TaxID=218934 RepID=UPI00261FB9EC|nr:NAD(P)H-dependent oxidoreductase [uncultured Campylobacter sp.]